MENIFDVVGVGMIVRKALAQKWRLNLCDGDDLMGKIVKVRKGHSVSEAGLEALETLANCGTARRA